MKLHQLLAIEKGEKTRSYASMTSLHKASQKPALYDGFAKTYEPLSEDDQRLPSERKKVQLNGESVLSGVRKSLGRYWGLVMSKDVANQVAQADVEVNGITLLRGAPPTYLLFLEKQLSDIRTFIEKMPLLDSAEDWAADPASGNFRTQPVKTHRTRKVAKVVTLAEATEHHPAQAQVVHEDVIAGHWSTTKFSGALPGPRKTELLERVDTLLNAVKVAREEANQVECVDSDASPIFDYLFGA
jgi:hypothetical protein